MITHVVVFWTDKPHGENRDAVLRGARELLPKVPGVLNFQCGTPVPSRRGAVDDSFAVAIAMQFETQEAADAYQAHPLHQEFVDKYFKPNVTRFVVYDFGE